MFRRTAIPFDFESTISAPPDSISLETMAQEAVIATERRSQGSYLHAPVPHRKSTSGSGFNVSPTNCCDFALESGDGMAVTDVSPDVVTLTVLDTLGGLGDI